MSCHVFPFRPGSPELMVSEWRCMASATCQTPNFSFFSASVWGLSLVKTGGSLNGTHIGGMKLDAILIGNFGGICPKKNEYILWIGKTRINNGKITMNEGASPRKIKWFSSFSCYITGVFLKWSPLFCCMDIEGVLFGIQKQNEFCFLRSHYFPSLTFTESAKHQQKSGPKKPVIM